jgi:EAL and modified HD-GYP domain-containing signal transduction protein
LFVDVMVRARLGQLLAERSPIRGLDGETQFTVGLLSSLDAFLGMELGQILNSIAIADDIKDAILNHRGDSGQLLSAALAYERAAFDDIEWPQLTALGIDAETLRDSYLESLRWANDTVQFLD